MLAPAEQTTDDLGRRALVVPVHLIAQVFEQELVDEREDDVERIGAEDLEDGLDERRVVGGHVVARVLLGEVADERLPERRVAEDGPEMTERLGRSVLPLEHRPRLRRRRVVLELARPDEVARLVLVDEPTVRRHGLTDGVEELPRVVLAGLIVEVELALERVDRFAQEELRRSARSNSACDAP